MPKTKEVSNPVQDAQAAQNCVINTQGYGCPHCRPRCPCCGRPYPSYPAYWQYPYWQYTYPAINTASGTNQIQAAGNYTVIN